MKDKNYFDDDEEEGNDLLEKHSVTKTKLCLAYDISFVTLRKWLNTAKITEPPFFGRKGYSREQVRAIVDKLGRP